MTRPIVTFQSEAEEALGRAIAKVTAPYQEEAALLHSVKDAGVCGVYSSRPAALRDMLIPIQEETSAVTIIGSSLKGLLQDQGHEYKMIRDLLATKINQSVLVQFLLTHPLIADFRAEQERRKWSDIGNEIIASINILKGMKVPAQNIRLYLGAPTCFSIRTSRVMLLNPYPYMQEAFASPCFLVTPGHFLFSHFSASHFQAWGSTMSIPVPEPALLRSAISGSEQLIQSVLKQTVQNVSSASSAQG